jgi:hypothetical protein
MNPEVPPEQPTNQPPQPAPIPAPQVNPLPPLPTPDASIPPSTAPSQTPPPPPNSSQGSELPSAFSLFKPSWETIKLNFVTLLSLYIIPLILGVILFVIDFHNVRFSFSANSTRPAFNAGILILSFVLFLIEIAVDGPLLYTVVKSAQGIKVSVSEAIKNGLPFVLRFLGLAIVLCVIIGIGFILIIVPGLILLKRYYLSPYAMFSEDLGIKASMNRSAELSKQPKAVWGLIGVQFLLGLISIIPVLGWIVSFIGGIAYAAAPAVRFEQLKALDGGSTPVSNNIPPAAPPSPTVTPTLTPAV